MKQSVIFWSGGKDSALALYRAQQDPEIEIKALICTLNKEYCRISMHGIREEILDIQVAEIGIPLIKMWVPNEPTNASYEGVLREVYQQLKRDGIDTVIFGDIFLEDLRAYREQILKEAGLNGYFPLWQKSTGSLIKEFIHLGFKTVTCCISTTCLDENWLGKEINTQFIQDLPLHVDACGENGEFHTFCFAGPIFKSPITCHLGERRFSPLAIKTKEQEKQTGFWYIDII